MPKKPIHLKIKAKPGRNYIHLAEIKRRGAGSGPHETEQDRPRKNQTRRWLPKQD